MNNKIRSGIFIVFLLSTACLSACSLFGGENAQPQNTAVPPAETAPPAHVIEPTVEQPLPTVEEPPADTEMAFWPLNFVLPTAVADGAGAVDVPPFDTDDAAWWQLTPGHLQVMLGDYYALRGKLHQPVIQVFPAAAYAEMAPLAFESLHRLNNILANVDAPIDADQLPAVPFLNARQVFASNIERIDFKNGAGVRFLTQYASGPPPANNHELFYQFQGVTGDGAFYIIAIFPVELPGLADDVETAKTLPVGGVMFPDMGDPDADWPGYYSAVTDMLNGASPQAFIPGLDQLDGLVQSMEIAP